VLSGAIEDWYAEASRSLFETIKREILRKDTGRSLIQVVVPHGGRAGLLAGLAGLVKTANRESSLVVSQVIELADSMPAGDAAAALLLDSGQHHVRHDGSGRWVQRWHETVRGGLPAGSPWRDGGVYLITGGYGGLGRMVATRIAQQTRHATLVLCGRSEALLDSPALAAMPMGDGLEIEYRQVDVSCGEQVERLVADMTRRFGRIDGIIHCAGVLRDKFIAAKSAQDFAEVFARAGFLCPVRFGCRGVGQRGADRLRRRQCVHGCLCRVPQRTGAGWGAARTYVLDRLAAVGRGRDADGTWCGGDDAADHRPGTAAHGSGPAHL
jgi:hypothetical protein